MIDFKYLWQKYNIKPKTVLHIGANSGQEAQTYIDFGVENVIWVEAYPPAFEQLCQNTWHIPNTKRILACVADDEHDIVFHVSNNEFQSSSMFELGHHKNIHPEVHYVEELKMKTQRLDSLINASELVGECFLNADIQGAELLALKGMGSLLNSFKWVYLEVNKQETYIGCASVYEIDEYLADYGFERVETGDWVADTWTDALYIRKKVAYK